MTAHFVRLAYATTDNKIFLNRPVGKKNREMLRFFIYVSMPNLAEPLVFLGKKDLNVLMQISFFRDFYYQERSEHECNSWPYL